VIGRKKNGDFLPFIPAHKLNFEIRADKEKLFFKQKAFVSINTSTSFSQNNAAPDETVTEGYTLIDLSLGGNIKVRDQLMSVSISANNLLDKKYIDHLSTLKEVGLFDPGRNIVLNLKIPFSINTK
jgi:iron complex outermembrane receptor protein